MMRIPAFCFHPVGAELVSCGRLVSVRQPERRNCVQKVSRTLSAKSSQRDGKGGPVPGFSPSSALWRMVLRQAISAFAASDPPFSARKSSFVRLKNVEWAAEMLV